MTRPPVLLFHGLTGAPAELQAVSRALRRAGYEVETPMLPGHGVDEKTLLRTGWKDWLGAAEEELIRLSDQAGGPVFVGGLSMGAVLALALAQRHPERVKGLAVLAVTLKYDGFNCPSYASWLLPLGAKTPAIRFYRFMERPPYGVKDVRMRAKIEEMMFSGSSTDAGLPFMPGRSLAENLKLVADVERRLPDVIAPALIVHSVEDDVTDIKNAHRLAASVSGPVQTLWLENSYHLVTVDQERVKVAQATIDFFDSLCAEEAAEAA
ncbi:MAG: alpha/beta fold hydrolase [Pseudomonadota bacterium]|jgi:carboxylesterase|nr:alpha/beta fold hydrolase [Pseudomonadota bacterium]